MQNCEYSSKLVMNAAFIFVHDGNNERMWVEIKCMEKGSSQETSRKKIIAHSLYIHTGKKILYSYSYAIYIQVSS